MADTRRRNPDPTNDSNGYGDLPGGAVGFRGLRGRDYTGGYGGGSDEFTGGVSDDGHGGPRDDSGFAPTRGHSSGYGAFGHVDPNDPDLRGGRGGDRPLGPHRGRGPKGYQRSDERIREDLCERLTDDPMVDASQVDVDVSGREVTLSGLVETRAARRRAEDIAEEISGVVHVQNDLRVRSGS